MTQHIRTLFEPLLRWLLPGRGCHRAVPTRPRAAGANALQRERHRTLWLAVHGIDARPRRIHGVKVAA
ncbi:hypothetical protein GTY73_32420 [Streptomyces sp. SID8354]|nr:hypothetical protein [Streptomyces sp. SID8354]